LIDVKTPKSDRVLEVGCYALRKDFLRGKTTLIDVKTPKSDRVLEVGCYALRKDFLHGKTTLTMKK
ncbi:hypothetical protein, partial [Brevibacillus sp. SIMBA_040]|uniref:hypothetical protein n=1 Tax=unclassified Brevibacillus TaxID=2684853 RepID=UPI00397BC246